MADTVCSFDYEENAPPISENSGIDSSERLNAENVVKEAPNAQIESSCDEDRQMATDRNIVDVEQHPTEGSFCSNPPDLLSFDNEGEEEFCDKKDKEEDEDFAQHQQGQYNLLDLDDGEDEQNTAIKQELNGVESIYGNSDRGNGTITNVAISSEQENPEDADNGKLQDGGSSEKADVPEYIKAVPEDVTASSADLLETGNKMPCSSPLLSESCGPEAPDKQQEEAASMPLPETDSMFGRDEFAKFSKGTTISAPVRAPRATMNISGCIAAGLKQLDSRVYDLLMWTEPKLTALLMGGILGLLIAFGRCSVFSVVAYGMLMVTIGTFVLRLGRTVVAQVHTGDGSHPFSHVLEEDLKLSEEAAAEYAQAAVRRFNQAGTALRDWILVKSYFTSFKFMLVLYALAWIGSWFNGLTVLTVAVAAAFTLPKAYDVNRVRVDLYLDLIEAKVTGGYKQLLVKIPYLGKQKTQ